MSGYSSCALNKGHIGRHLSQSKFGFFLLFSAKGKSNKCLKEGLTFCLD